MIIDEDDYLAHYGTKRHSGRYPWGSGEHPYERDGGGPFLARVEELRKKGMKDPEIASALGLKSTTQLRAARSIAKNQQKQSQISQAQRLREAGNSNSAIGRIMGLNESSVRALLAPGQQDKTDRLNNTIHMLKQQVAKKDIIDVGTGIDRHIGVSDTQLRTAVAALEQDGYKVQYVKVPQLGTGKFTTRKVLVKADMPYSELYRRRDEIQLPTDISTDNGQSFTPIQKPLSVSSKRIAVRYAEQGGSEADGVMYIRPGVKDLSMGSDRYAQVRIAVDGTHYLKGMAMYNDQLPHGVDILFNTSKHDTGNKLDAMKKMHIDPKTGEVDELNPFGAIVHQKTDPKTGKVTSALNFVGTKEGAGEEGAWSSWSRTLSSQFLSKQAPSLAKAQLDMAYERKQAQFDQIMALTNPTVRRKLLEEFASGADSSAVHLKAAALPRQANHVILPISSLKDTEIYAPNYKHGERVVLIRHPHAGTFEIPELTVNNRNAEAKRLLANAQDAVGINHRVAQHLSGADFDGDTVLVIPNNQGKVKTSAMLAGLKNFDPISAYPKYEGMKVMTAREKGVEMGRVSNLITDMTLKGASTAELTRAVRHSMVVIDAEKHELNYKQSEINNGIPALMLKYQGKTTGGASTLISRAKQETRIPERTLRLASQGGPVDKKTGKLIYVPTGRQYTNKKGKTSDSTDTLDRLAVTADARDLVSANGGTKMEHIYAEHSNKLKALADKARLEAVHTPKSVYSTSARKTYANEVASLRHKLNIALRNAPLERQAQTVANSIVRAQTAGHPEIDKAELKKIKALALAQARVRTGAKKTRIEVTSREWEAIQAGAVSSNMLSDILTHADLERIKELATPKVTSKLSATKLSRARQMIKQGYTQGEVAAQLGVSVSTLKAALSGGD